MADETWMLNFRGSDDTLPEPVQDRQDAIPESKNFERFAKDLMSSSVAKDGLQYTVSDAFEFAKANGLVDDSFKDMNFKRQLNVLAKKYAGALSGVPEKTRDMFEGFIDALNATKGSIDNTYQEALFGTNFRYGYPFASSPDDRSFDNSLHYTHEEVMPSLEGVSRDSAFRIPFKDSWGSKPLGERVKLANEYARDGFTTDATDLLGGTFGLPGFTQRHAQKAVGMGWGDLDKEGVGKMALTTAAQAAAQGLYGPVAVSPISGLGLAGLGALNGAVSSYAGNTLPEYDDPDEGFSIYNVAEKYPNAVRAGFNSLVEGGVGGGVSRVKNVAFKNNWLKSKLGGTKSAKEAKKMLDDYTKRLDENARLTEETKGNLNSAEYAENLVKKERSQWASEHGVADDENMWRNVPVTVSLPTAEGKRTFRGTYGQFSEAVGRTTGRKTETLNKAIGNEELSIAKLSERKAVAEAEAEAGKGRLLEAAPMAEAGAEDLRRAMSAVNKARESADEAGKNVAAIESRLESQARAVESVRPDRTKGSEYLRLKDAKTQIQTELKQAKHVSRLAGNEVKEAERELKSRKNAFLKHAKALSEGKKGYDKRLAGIADLDNKIAAKADNVERLRADLRSVGEKAYESDEIAKDAFRNAVSDKFSSGAERKKAGLTKELSRLEADRHRMEGKIGKLETKTKTPLLRELFYATAPAIPASFYAPAITVSQRWTRGGKYAEPETIGGKDMPISNLNPLTGVHVGGAETRARKLYLGSER